MQTELDFSVLDPANAVLTLRRDLRIAPREFDGEDCYVIEDPLRGKFFRIGRDEFTLISLLDGKKTIAQAVGLAAGLLHDRAFAENEAMSVCHWLLESQLAVCDGSSQGERLAESARKQAAGRFASLLNPLAIRLPLWNPSTTLARIAPYFDWLFSKQAFFVWCAVCFLGLCTAAGHWTDLVQSSSVLLDRDNWLRLAIVWLILKILHEMSHALACYHYGGTVPTAGVLLVLLAPLPFVDVTAAWRFPSKWQRMATAAAGMYFELFVASLAIMLWANSTNEVLRHLTLNVAAAASVGSLLINGNPLMRFDGYYILSDLLEIPNLSAAGQQYLARLFQRLLGVETPPDNRSRRTRRIIAVYAFAAMFWRLLVMASLLLILYAMASKLGTFVGLVAVLVAGGLPLYRPVRRAVEFVRKQPVLSMRRMGLLAAGAGGCLLLGIFFATRPSTIHAYGVVDYSPPTIIRATSPGFVQELKVHEGQTVDAGQVLLIMRNEELQVQLADVRAEIQQSAIRSRMLRQGEERAKAQAEDAQRRSLQKKEAEIKKLVESLTVRSPIRGEVVARNLDALTGRYLSVGDEIMVVGNEETKEITLAVPQDDIRSFVAQDDRPVTVRIVGKEDETFRASLSKIEPRASRKPPHPALGADAGGNLPVKPKRDPQSTNTVENELLDPCFTATVPLTVAESQQLHAGQRATVVFKSAEQSWAGRLVRTVSNAIDRKLAAVDHTN